MNTLRALIIVGIVCAGLQYWNRHQAALALAAATDENGFLELPPTDGQKPDTVYVIAALNCPHEDAQRADRLAEELNGKGIPAIRTDHVNFQWTDVDTSAAHEYADRTNAVMNGRLPIAFVRGRAKSDATLDQVVAEFTMLQR